MKFSQMRDVVAIAERGSLRAAARHLSLAQPALTRSIHELERELGVPLFERRARGMILTPMGEAFVRRASAVLSEVRRARDEVEQLHGGTRGRVVAGLSLAAHVALLPSALKPFRARYPQVQLHLIEGWYPTLEAGLKDGSVDFYVGPEHERAPAPELIQELLFKNTRIVGVFSPHMEKCCWYKTNLLTLSRCLKNRIKHYWDRDTDLARLLATGTGRDKLSEYAGSAGPVKSK